MANVKNVAPGIGLCAAIAIPCWFLGEALPVVGGPVFAILIGMVIALWWKQPARGTVQDGIAFTAKKVLQYAVILLGFGLNLAQIAAVGAESLPIILTTIATALIVGYILYRVLSVDSAIATLIAVGSSICGGSAIAATAPVIRAKDEQVAQAISVIFLFNVVAALIFPTLGGMLGMSNEGFGLFAGTAVNDTSSVTAAAAAWDGMHPGSNALDDATIVKLTRTLAIIPITFVLALWGAHKVKKAHKQKRAELAAAHEDRAAELEGEVHELHNEGFSLKRSFPLFILYFLLASLITTIALGCGVSTEAFAPIKTLSKFFITMAMVAIGLNTDLVKLVKSGGKPIFLGFCCCLAIAGVSLGMQYMLGLW